MSESEHNNVFAIPTNYTDSGKALGGMVETRNLVEAVFFALLIGFPEFKLIHLSIEPKAAIMVLTIVPIVLLACVGIDGDSLLQFLGHAIKFLIDKRKLHFRRVGYYYDKKDLHSSRENKVTKAIKTVTDFFS